MDGQATPSSPSGSPRLMNAINESTAAADRLCLRIHGFPPVIVCGLTDTVCLCLELDKSSGSLGISYVDDERGNMVYTS
jgi:hypothetical protein